MDINLGISYLISRDGNQFGPYQGSELAQLVQSKQIISSDHLWTEGMDGWVPAGSINQLAPAFAALEARKESPAPTHSMAETSLPSDGPCA